MNILAEPSEYKGFLNVSMFPLIFTLITSTTSFTSNFFEDLPYLCFHKKTTALFSYSYFISLSNTQLNSIITAESTANIISLMDKHNSW